MRQASLLPALQQLDCLDEGVSSWVSAARGATSKEVAATSKKKKGSGGKKAKPAASTPLRAPLGATNPFRGSERERWQRRVGAADSAASLAPHVLRLES